MICSQRYNVFNQTIKMSTHLFNTSHTQVLALAGNFDIFKNPRSPLVVVPHISKLEILGYFVN